MTHTLLAIAVGPVQDFIAAARKTRDLWFGSLVLSEISKAVARALADALDQLLVTNDAWSRLVFPAPHSADDLMPADPAVADDVRERLNVANVILLDVPFNDPDRLKWLANLGKRAAEDRWRDYADAARKKIVDDEKSFETDPKHKPLWSLWESQVDDIVESYAAWAPYDPAVQANDAAGSYSGARRRVMALLAARKQCRDFQWHEGRSGIPKSSLDGARESITAGLSERLVAHLRLRSNSVGQSRFGGEQLDCVGLTKRLAGGRQTYPSVTRVAADPWIRGASHDARASASFDAFTSEIAWLEREEKGLVHPVPGAQFGRFPYEGDFAYSNRHQDFLKESGYVPESIRASDLARRLGDLGKALTKATDAIGIPDPYLAVLQADGDKVGASLGQMASAAAHRIFSQHLAEFAKHASGIVERHQGVLIYAGGDDVLALLPVDLCVLCARELHDLFGCVMNEAFEEIAKTQEHSPGADRPTLSVGIAIGHMLEPMEYLRQYALDAEKHAKNRGKDDPADGLAIHVHPRGGAPFELRERWRPVGAEASTRQPIDRRLMTWVDLIVRDQLSHRAAYELRELALSFANWDRSALADATKKAARELSKEERAAVLAQVKADVAVAVNRGALHILNRKEGNSKDARAKIERLLVGVATPAELTAVAHELLVARRIAAAAKFDPKGFRAAADLPDPPAPGGVAAYASPVRGDAVSTAGERTGSATPESIGERP